MKINKTQTLTVRFSSHLYNKICLVAEEQSVTNAEAIRMIVQSYFTEQDEAARLDAAQSTILDAVKQAELNISNQINNLIAS
jgi:predicted DNA-binding protein (UPF0251 family)